MIYLIESVWHDKEDDKVIDLVKIGYTENFNKRWNAYKLHNPLCKIINSIEDGTEDDEKRLHYYFKDLIYPDYGREWFTFDQSILDFFNTHKTSKSLSSLPLPPKEEIPPTDEMILKEWIKENSESLSDSIRDWLEGVYLKPKYLIRDKIRSFCESPNLTSNDREFLLNKLPVDLFFKEYYLILGPERCRAVSYCRSDLEKELSINKFDKTDLKRELDFIFKIGEVYALSEVKEKLGTLYNTLEYKKTPKANDLLEYYEVKDCMKSMNKKRIACYKIIKKL